MPFSIATRWKWFLNPPLTSAYIRAQCKYTNTHRGSTTLWCVGQVLACVFGECSTFAMIYVFKPRTPSVDDNRILILKSSTHGNPSIATLATGSVTIRAVHLTRLVLTSWKLSTRTHERRSTVLFCFKPNDGGHPPQSANPESGSRVFRFRLACGARRAGLAIFRFPLNRAGFRWAELLNWTEHWEMRARTPGQIFRGCEKKEALCARQRKPFGNAPIDSYK